MENPEYIGKFQDIIPDNKAETVETATKSGSLQYTPAVKYVQDMNNENVKININKKTYEELGVISEGTMQHVLFQTPTCIAATEQGFFKTWPNVTSINVKMYLV